jgi:hypothetical protein
MTNSKVTKERNYTAGERAVAVIGVLAGKTCDEINAQLRKDRKKDGGSERLLNEESYKMLVRKYAPVIDAAANERWTKAWEHITAPKSLSDLGAE